jgi:hypothetical protein
MEPREMVDRIVEDEADPTCFGDDCWHVPQLAVTSWRRGKIKHTQWCWACWELIAAKAAISDVDLRISEIDG